MFDRILRSSLALSPKLGCLHPVAGVALLALVTASPASALTLVGAFELALSHDAELAAARYRNQSEREVYDQRRARLLPQVQFDGNYGTRETERESVGLQRAFRPYDSVGISASQPIYNRELWYRFQQSKEQVSASDLSLLEQRQTLALDVAESYYGILLAERTLELARAEAESFHQQWQKIEKTLASGFASRADSLEAKARYDSANSQVLVAENRLKTARLRLERRIGRKPDEVRLGNIGITEYLPEPVDAGQWRERIEQGNLAIRRARYSLEIARKELEAQRSGHYPRLDLSASLLQSYDQDPSRTDGLQKQLQLQLTIPLYEGGGTDSRVRQSAYAVNEAQEALRAALEEQSLRGDQVLDELLTAQSSIVALKSSVTSWNASVESSERAYKLGFKDLLTVLDSRARLYASQRDLASAVQEELLSRLRLKALAGDLHQVQAMEEVSQLLY